MRRLLIYLSIFTLIISLSSVIVSKNITNNSDSSNYGVSLARCMEANSEAKIICIKKISILALEKNEFSELTDEIAKILPDNPGLGLVCHKIFHTVGDVAIKSYETHEKMLRDITSQVCDEGMIHGSITSFAESGPSSEQWQEMADACIKTVIYIGKWWGSQCSHGIAHGISVDMSDEEDLISQFSFCKKILKIAEKQVVTPDEVKEDLQRNCGYGLMMSKYWPVVIDYNDIRNPKPSLEAMVETCQNTVITENLPFLQGCVGGLGFAYGEYLVNNGFNQTPVSLYDPILEIARECRVFDNFEANMALRCMEQVFRSTGTFYFESGTQLVSFCDSLQKEVDITNLANHCIADIFKLVTPDTYRQARSKDPERFTRAEQSLSMYTINQFYQKFPELKPIGEIKE